jgi:anion-transporting  ArsA/GET3 family ATPase
VWELAQFERRTAGASAYDVVIVDAPATGHGVAVLRTPRTFAEIARVGPIARTGKAIAESIADDAFTGVLAVATPEEMAVNETLSLRAGLAADGLALDAVILNALYPDRFAAAELETLAGLNGLVGERDAACSALATSAVRAALSEHARASTQREQRDRLRDGLEAPPLELPYLFCERIGPAELEALADVLQDHLEQGRG